MAHLQARAADLDTALNVRLADIERLKADVAAFRRVYSQRVGLLHDELDDLQDAIVAAIAGLADDDPRRRRRKAPGLAQKTDAAPRLTSDAVRKLFRDVAKAIHPDLAHNDDEARDQRHALMIAANQAYALGDEERLRMILHAWEQNPETVPGAPDAARERLVRRVAQLEAQLAACDGELGALRESPLCKLKAMVDEAADRGKDLVGDMVRRLERDIMVARNRLAAIRGGPG